MEVETLSQRGKYITSRIVCLSAERHSNFKKEVKHMAWVSAHGASYEVSRMTEHTRLGLLLMNGHGIGILLGFTMNNYEL